MAGRFCRHFKMEENDAIEFVQEKMEYFDQDAQLVCKEIGDGNINYVFRVEDSYSGKSVILKHADVQVRSSGSLVSTDRNRIEVELLELQGELAPGLVPKVYLYDPVMCCMVMEDLKDYGNMRYELIAHHIFPEFASEMTTFLAETLIRTTDHVMTPHEKKHLVKKYVNPDLCKVTEDLVYTDPYTDARGRNRLNPINEDFFKVELYQDLNLRLEAAKLKEQFQTNSQSLLHGDLHTGSIFINKDAVKVLDPEFAFYGPMGYDVGNVAANLIFAWVNAEVTMKDGEEKKLFMEWLEVTIRDLIDLFYQKAITILKEVSADPISKTPGYFEWYMRKVLEDTAGVAGLELNRRIVGSAKVKDIAGIENPEDRALAERICVLIAKCLIMKREQENQNGSRYVDLIKEVAAKTKNK